MAFTLPELPYSNIGTIFTSSPDSIRNSLPVDGPCPSCDIKWVCGGRCLYANQTMSWGMEWFERTCQTTRHMINELDRLVPRIKELMANGTIPMDAFNYPEINNGCEIIP